MNNWRAETAFKSEHTYRKWSTFLYKRCVCLFIDYETNWFYIVACNWYLNLTFASVLFGVSSFFFSHLVLDFVVNFQPHNLFNLQTMETWLQAQISYSYLFSSTKRWFCFAFHSMVWLKQVLHCMLTLFGHIKSICFDGACLETDRDVCITLKKGFQLWSWCHALKSLSYFNLIMAIQCSSFIMQHKPSNDDEWVLVRRYDCDYRNSLSVCVFFFCAYSSLKLPRRTTEIDKRNEQVENDSNIHKIEIP